MVDCHKAFDEDWNETSGTPDVQRQKGACLDAAGGTKERDQIPDDD
jgi:hypothetical protein